MSLIVLVLAGLNYIKCVASAKSICFVWSCWFLWEIPAPWLLSTYLIHAALCLSWTYLAFYRAFCLDDVVLQSCWFSLDLTTCSTFGRVLLEGCVPLIVLVHFGLTFIACASDGILCTSYHTSLPVPSVVLLSRLPYLPQSSLTTQHRRGNHPTMSPSQAAQLMDIIWSCFVCFDEVRQPLNALLKHPPLEHTPTLSSFRSAHRSKYSSAAWYQNLTEVK